jgi:predicted TIM-barrel fold metal-dependent hydrolase
MTTTFDDLSARIIDDDSKAAAENIPEFIVSADSHVDEPVDLWYGLPEDGLAEIPQRIPFPPGTRPEGGADPKIRIEHMDLDGMSAEVLYPTAALKLFEFGPEVQEAAFPIYNDWVAEYCKTAPKRLFAVPCLAVYDIDKAVKELQRCHDMGLKGGLVWQVPHPDLPILSDHYEKLWSAAEELGAVINFHILTGYNYKKGLGGGINYEKGIDGKSALERMRGSVNIKTTDAITTLFELIFSGVFERHPKLRVDLVEAEIGWMPFVLQQWDYYYARNFRPGGAHGEYAISRKPSEIFNDHVYATFMDDVVGSQLLNIWGERNCMWSSDYPHGNMTWPNSRAFLARQIGDLPAEKQARLLSENVVELYGLDV